MQVTVNDLIARWDARLVADLARDDGQPETNLANNPRILAALKGAMGQLRSAILKGRRYSVDELDQLAEEDKEFLKDIVCGLAILRLAACRVSTLGGQVYESLSREMKERLEELEQGKLIFATPSAVAAGLPKTEGPTLAETLRLNLLVDRCHRYYPSRAERY